MDRRSATEKKHRDIDEVHLAGSNRTPRVGASLSPRNRANCPRQIQVRYHQEFYGLRLPRHLNQSADSALSKMAG